MNIHNQTLAAAIKAVEGRIDNKVAEDRLKALTLLRADLAEVENFLNERAAFFEVSLNDLAWMPDPYPEEHADEQYCFVLYGRRLRDLDPVIIHKNIEKNIPPLLGALAEIVGEMRQIT